MQTTATTAAATPTTTTPPTIALAAHGGASLRDALRTYVEAPSDEAALALLSDGLATTKPVDVLRALIEVAGHHFEAYGFDGARALDDRVQCVVRIALRLRNRPSRKQRAALARAAMQLGLHHTYNDLIHSAQITPKMDLRCLAGTNPYWFGEALERARNLTPEDVIDLALRYLGMLTTHARLAPATRTTFLSSQRPCALLLRSQLDVGGLNDPRLHAATHDAVEAWLAHAIAAPQYPPPVDRLDWRDTPRYVLRDLAQGVYASLTITDEDDRRKRERLLERVAAYLTPPSSSSSNSNSSAAAAAAAAAATAAVVTVIAAEVAADATNNVWR